MTPRRLLPRPRAVSRLLLPLLLAASPLLMHAAAARAQAQAQVRMPASAPAWARRLVAELQEIDGRQGPAIGVYVRDLDTGESAGFHADERWYLASTVKLPIAVTVLRAVEAGRLSLDTPVALHATDYVDGPGSTNRQPEGARIPVRRLLEQMMVHSDNTASDLLIGQVGIDAVNATVRTLVPRGFERITPLAEVRREIYAGLDPAGARALSGRDFVDLQAQPTDAARLALFARLGGVPPGSFAPGSLDSAYDRYYRGGLNSGRLDAYADLLQAVAEGRALRPEATAWLLAVMRRVATGRNRVVAGLPPTVDFAHKTGTQRRRICDSGILAVERAAGAPAQRVVLVACARDEPSLPRAERALRQVGQALCRSGLITKGVPDAPTCHAAVGASRLPAAASQRSGR